MEFLILDLGLALGLLGALSVVKPLRWLGIRTRRRGALLLGVGAALAVVAGLLPAKTVHVEPRTCHLDEIVPAYQFHERHEIRIAAPPDRVFQAVKSVTAREIRLFRLLTWLRSPRLGKGGEESILNPSPDRPILEVATASGFMLLAEEPAREIVLGTVLFAPRGTRAPADFGPPQLIALARPGFAKAVMNFHLSPQVDGTTLLVTETRVFATDPASVRRFAPYWRLIYPGSALIRVMWLKAIRARAEVSP